MVKSNSYAKYTYIHQYLKCYNFFNLGKRQLQNNGGITLLYNNNKNHVKKFKCQKLVYYKFTTFNINIRILIEIN